MKRKSNKRKTNVQIVKDIMEFSRRGGLAQAFVMVALEEYAKEAVKVTEKEWGKNAFISWEAWVDVAKEVLEKLNQDKS